MIEIFAEAFTSMLGAVGRIFLIILAAGFLVRKNILTDEHVNSLSKVTVNILLPCMLFAEISQNFHPAEMKYWWVMPLSSASLILLGIFFVFLFYIRSFHEKSFLFPLASMQNAVYLVLPIGRFMYPDEFDQYAIYNFLFLIGFMPLVWSLGKVLITGSSFKSVKPREFITPPLVAAFITLAMVFTGLRRFVPDLVMDSVDLVGEATIPVSNIVLGATLGGISFKILPKLSDVLKLTTVKFVLLPVVVITILHFVGLKEQNPLMANMLVIESAAAPATALVLQVRAYGGDRQTVGSLMLISYVVCLLAIPFWIGVWQFF
jgi:hypothetical protein